MTNFDFRRDRANCRAGLTVRVLACLQGVVLALFAQAAAAQQDLPDRLGPIQTGSDINGVNLLTGKTTVPMPVLAVPAAPHLRYENAASAAPFVVGKDYGGDPDFAVKTYTVNLANGGSDSFRCMLGNKCLSVTGNGSVLGSGGRTYRHGNSGELYSFSYTHFAQLSGQYPRTVQYYLGTISYPSGETITYSYDAASLTGDPYNRSFYRTNRMTSNLGYYITLSFAGSDINADANAWQTVTQATLYKASAPSVPILQLTYGSGGSITDLAGRVFYCSGCPTAMGSTVERSSASYRLPGEASPAVQYTSSSSNSSLIGSVVRDGKQWNYAYQNARSSGPGWWFDAVTVTGPDGYSKTYSIGQTDKQNILKSITETVSSGVSRTVVYSGGTGFVPTTETQPEQNSVRVAYDDYGNITERRNVAKPSAGLADLTETASYPSATCNGVLCYRPDWSRDAKSAQTDYIYNAAGYVTERTDPADADGVRRKAYITYDSNGLNRKTVVRVCGSGGACGTSSEIRTEYDYWESTFLPATERRIDQATGVTLATTYSYDAAGRILITDGPLSGTDDAVYARYDVIGRKTWDIGAKGGNGLRTATRFTYRNSDDKAIVVETGTVTDPASTTLTVLERVDTSYDAGRNPVRVSRSAGGTVYAVADASFDSQNRPICQTVRMSKAVFGSLPASACTLSTAGSDGSDRITRNTYDYAGQLTRVEKAVGTSLQQNYATYGYTPNGRRASVKDANGNLATMSYDGRDRQSAWYFPSKTAVGQASGGDYEAYGYDANGNRISLRRRDGRTLTFGYDALNRATSKVVPDGCAPLQVGPCTPTTATRDVYYGYDLRGLQTFARFDSVSGEGIGNAYDRLGRLTSTTSIMGGVSRTIGYVYDGHDNRTQISTPNGSWTYTYDAADRLSGLYEGVGTSVVLSTWNYEAHGLPSSVAERFGSGTSWTYDAIARLSGQSDTFGGGTGNVSRTLSYNAAGQLTTQTRSNDAYAFTGFVTGTRNYAVNGLNQYTSAGSLSISYDSNGNLLSDGLNSYVYDAENRLVSASNGATLSYDPLGRLWQVSGSAGTRRFLHDGDQLTAEYDVSGNLLDRYVHGPGADDPLVWYPAGGAAVRWYHRDHLGSIVASSAGPSGAMAGINAYDQYGIPNAGNTGRFQYTGQAWLPEFGMYHYKARVYSPTLGRFLQADPIGYDDQINLYAYVANDPVNRRDPTGTEGVVDDVINWGKMVASDIVELGQGIARGDLGWALGGMPPTLGGGVVATAASAPARIAAAEARATVRSERTFQTYTKVNERTREVYTGRTSGTGTPAQNVARRDASRYPSREYGPARLDKSSSNPQAIRGREQQMIERNGGAQSQGGNSGNRINGISDRNPTNSACRAAANREFGPC